MFIAYDVFVAQEILGKENCCSDVSSRSKAKQGPSDGHPTPSFGAVNDLGELTNFLPARKRPCADTDESGDLFIRALHPIKLFKFTDVNLDSRSRHGSILLFE
jgi:hypothetical protein